MFSVFPVTISGGRPSFLSDISQGYPLFCSSPVAIQISEEQQYKQSLSGSQGNDKGQKGRGLISSSYTGRHMWDPCSQAV